MIKANAPPLGTRWSVLVIVAVNYSICNAKIAPS
jgi:hypothetical protein